MGRKDWTWGIGVAIFFIVAACLLLHALYGLWPPPVPKVQPGFTLYALDPVKVAALPQPTSASRKAIFDIAVLSNGGYNQRVELKHDLAREAKLPGTITLEPSSLTPGTTDVRSQLAIELKTPDVKPGKYYIPVTGSSIDRVQKVHVVLVLAPANAVTVSSTLDRLADDELDRTVPLGKPADVESQDVRPVSFLWMRDIPMLEEARLWILVLAAAALGALVHGLRSLFWYVGNREFKASWVLMYLCLPLTGGIIGLGTYFVIRGGFFSPTTTAEDTSSYSFVGVAFLIGLFSAQASEKLKHIFEAMFTVPPQGKDHTAPKAADFSINPEPTMRVATQLPASVSYTLSVRSEGGFATPVALSITSLPIGITGAFNPSPVTPLPEGATSELTLTVAADALPGQYQITITGTAGEKTKTCTVALVVQGAQLPTNGAGAALGEGDPATPLTAEAGKEA